VRNNIGDRLLFIDTETGGIDPNKHSLLSIGLVVWEIGKKIIDSTEILIKHDEYYITSTAQSINKFEKHQHEINAVSPKEAIATMLKFCNLYFEKNLLVPLAGHNTQFDVGFLKVFLKENNRSYNELFSHRIIDTYTLLRSLFYSGKISEDIASSAQAFRYFDIYVDGRHTAKGDAIATVELYNKLLELL
jgi:DNA polymerase-3 subunit epsilon